MTKKEVLDIIDNLKIAKFQIKKFLKNHYPIVYQFIIDNTTFLGNDESISIIERIYCLRNNITKKQLCRVCNKNEVKFDTVNNIYRKWCSIPCSCKDKETVAKSKKSRLERYGSETYVGSDKAKQTRLKKNNGHFHSVGFCEKCKQTKLKHYGNENYVNVEKCKQTKLLRYGDENYTNSDKCKATKLKNHGDENYNNREKFKATLSTFDTNRKQQIIKKRQKTVFDKYGVTSVKQLESVKEKTKNTCIQKYGCEHTLQLEKVRLASAQKIREKSWHFIQKEKDYVPMFSHDEYVNNLQQHIWKWKCNKCGDIFESKYDNGQHHRCYKCQPNNVSGTSLIEQSIECFIKTLTDHEIISHNRSVMKDREIDIYIPDLKLGIEFDGLYYHSEQNGKDRNYHLDKTERCEQQGIQLFHIFEDEWTNKQKIVKSRLKHIICKSQRRIFARKCEIREVDNSVKDLFLEKYHIQGKDISKLRYGLYYNNHLVAIMTFIKSRFNKNYQWELSRYATVSNFTVVGGASKLLKYFERNNKPTSLITYADRRWSNGNMYYKLGFQILHKSAPNYFYIKDGLRHNRMQFQKHKLSTTLDKYDEKLTEAQNMNINGYMRIFDCGNLVFSKTYN